MNFNSNSCFQITVFTSNSNENFPTNKSPTELLNYVEFRCNDPVMTGCEIKLTINPSFSSPTNIRINPVKKLKFNK